MVVERSRSRRDARFIGVDLHKVRLLLDDRPVLRGIDWRIQPSQRWVLMGPNGAGKTQLMKLLAGDVWPSGTHPGERHYHYRDETLPDPYGVKQHIAYLGAERQDRYEHYEWNQRVELVVGTGLYRSDIPLDSLTTVDRERTGLLLRRLRIEALARRRFLTLSYGERRLVLLARALAWAPKLLLLDEIFNGLDELNRGRVQHCLRLLSRSAMPWVLSTHRIIDLPAYATHLCQLEHGKIIAQDRLSARLRRELAMREVTMPRHLPIATTLTAAPAMITLRNATIWREGVAVLRRLSLRISRGDCWVVHGANGSGKSSFIQLLYGDLAAASGGSIVRAGIDVGVPLTLFKRHVGLVAPELQALHPRYLGVDEVVASGLEASIGLNEGLSVRQRARARRALERVGAIGLAGRTIRTLSYGQLRRVLFARALVHQPDMLLLDEPYSGLDARTRINLRLLVQQALDSGVTIVIAIHHRDEWPQGVSHELEIARSRVSYCGPLRTGRTRAVRK